MKSMKVSLIVSSLTLLHRFYYHSFHVSIKQMVNHSITNGYFFSNQNFETMCGCNIQDYHLFLFITLARHQQVWLMNIILKHKKSKKMIKMCSFNIAYDKLQIIVFLVLHNCLPTETEHGVIRTY